MTETTLGYALVAKVTEGSSHANRTQTHEQCDTLRKLQSGRKAAGDKTVTESCYSTDEELQTKTYSHRVKYADSVQMRRHEPGVSTNLRFPLYHTLQVPRSQLLPSCRQHDKLDGYLNVLYLI